MRLERQAHLSWLIFRDFNEILFQPEKHGGQDPDFNNMLAFHKCLLDCNLNDLGFSKYNLT